MPRWICPSCNAVMNVKSSLLGQVKPCVRCSVESMVADSESTEIPGIISVDPSSIPQGESVEKTLGKIRDNSPLFIKVYQGFLLVLLVLVSLRWVFIDIPRDPTAIIVLPFIWAGFGLAWLAADFMSDVFRCRLLLEEIYRGQRKS